MATVRTVLGDIDSSQLGRTNAHEHLFIRDGLIVLLEPDYRLDSEANALSEVADFRAHGGQAIVDTSPLGIGHHPEGLMKVARATGVHVIASTGFSQAALLSGFALAESLAGRADCAAFCRGN